MKRAILLPLVLAVLFAPAGIAQTKKGVPKGAKGSQLIVRSVLPADTDSRIDKFSGNGWEHQVILNPGVAKKQQLVVFLPGTGGKGPGPKDFSALAANEGFHVMSIAYPSTISISNFRESKDPETFRIARENILYGKPSFKGTDVNEPNSIRNRLIKLLRHQAKTHPKEMWGQYLTESGLNWKKLILSGQSQGGGHAALLGMQHEVARVLMFGAPKDFSLHFNKPGKWLTGASATPLNRYFGFVHRGDDANGSTYAQTMENYRAMKLAPQYPVVNVDETPAPYRNSRLLTSTRALKFPHGAVIGESAYKEVWKYMLEEPVQ
jgi:hypothetical protein